MLFRFLVAFYFISIWPHITWNHVFWAAFVAAITWPLKKLWDAWATQFWAVFKVSFLARFKQTPQGQQFIEEFHKAKSAKCEALIKEHPELEKVLQCKTCGGKGCDDCGGTGWG